MVGFRVGIHHFRDTANEPDDALGVEVPRGSFASEEHGFPDELRALLRAGPLQVAVTLDDCQCIKQLALVPAVAVSRWPRRREGGALLVDSLDVHVEHGGGVNVEAPSALQIHS